MVARVELYERGVVIYNLFTVWHITNSMIKDVARSDDRLSLTLLDGRRVDVMSYQEGLVMGMFGSSGNAKLIRILRSHFDSYRVGEPMVVRRFRIFPIRLWLPAIGLWTMVYWSWFNFR
jgi:hypothetical protein